MRISWLEPSVVQAARAALKDVAASWDEHFESGFEAPPAPDGVSEERWPKVVEHVARAERVSQVVRERGLEPALNIFADSEHAIELATLVSAAAIVEQVSFELVASLLRCDVDDLVVYGSFLAMMVEHAGDERREQAVALYEQFCEALGQCESNEPMWADRVGAVRDGLASLYVMSGRLQEAHDLFEERHQEQDGDLVVALAASRSFLASGQTGRAIQWLNTGAERAHQLGRASMALRLSKKAEALRERLS
jgi:hypothetical protein